MGKTRKNWSDEEIIKALTAIRAGKSIRQTSLQTGIPKSTLQAKITGNRPIGKKTGPSSILKADEETSLVTWIMHRSKLGFPITRTQLINSVAHLIKQLNRKNPFTNGIPGRQWVKAFFKRHPEITSQVSQCSSNGRASVTEKVLRGWFREVEKYLIEKNLVGIDGARVFNVDELTFYLNPKNERVIVKKGNKAVNSFVQNDEKECLTVLFTTNARGTLAPPMILFPYERIPYSISQSMPPGWSIGKADNGWMTGETFFKYVCNVFEPWLTTNCIQRPVILFVDGHSSHLTMPLTDFCRNHQIELIALFPNATHLIQPLDVALFCTLKAAWRNSVVQWRSFNDNKKLRREDFGPLLQVSIDSIDLPEVMSDGFRKTGLHPFSVDAIENMDLLRKRRNDDNTALEDNVEQAGNEKTDTEICLAVLEKTMDPLVLAQCRRAEQTETWTGAVEDIGLYFLWRKISTLSSIHD